MGAFSRYCITAAIQRFDPSQHLAWVQALGPDALSEHWALVPSSSMAFLIVGPMLEGLAAWHAALGKRVTMLEGQKSR